MITIHALQDEKPCLQNIYAHGQAEMCLGTDLLNTEWTAQTGTHKALVITQQGELPALIFTWEAQVNRSTTLIKGLVVLERDKDALAHAQQLQQKKATAI